MVVPDSRFFELVAGIGEALSFTRFDGAVKGVSIHSESPLIVSVSFVDDVLHTLVVDVDDWAVGTVPTPTTRQIGFDIGLQQIAEPGDWDDAPAPETLNTIGVVPAGGRFRFVGDVAETLARGVRD